MTATTNHRWLMQYNIVNLVNQCRRLIRAEFDESLSLSDPALREKLAYFAGRSRSRGMQRVYAEIRLALIDLEGPDELVTPQARAGNLRYRGQAIIADEDQPKQRGSTSAEKTLIYRGRVVASQ